MKIKMSQNYKKRLDKFIRSVAAQPIHINNEKLISESVDQDYRYFLENDIPWVKIDQSTRDRLKENMPESISSKKERYIEKFDIAPQDADIIASDRYYSKLFENAYSDHNTKDIANLITTDSTGTVQLPVDLAVGLLL